ncbi:YuiB family protein [Fictibacillus sp. WQ 8-8]|uniref:YuiB family protein n=1 Tax=Fictibacillus sp. WQ 8-8 TaxID=2938788 RepID=UPI00210CE758|nr:YuiB family protein [Fictibacillus sp. WQ 8-8]MCQ6268010.1 YuiB family protein [Fictibacillus sp. WQ 8-8]
MYLPQLFISMLLFIVLFFGIGFLLNMLLRSTWIMAVIYPVVVIMIIDHVKFFKYFSSPGKSFAELGEDFIHLQAVDICILVSGMVGAIFAGMAIKMLRVRGYQMF